MNVAAAVASVAAAVVAVGKAAVIAVAGTAAVDAVEPIYIYIHMRRELQLASKSYQMESAT